MVLTELAIIHTYIHTYRGGTIHSKRVAWFPLFTCSFTWRLSSFHGPCCAFSWWSSSPCFSTLQCTTTFHANSCRAFANRRRRRWCAEWSSKTSSPSATAISTSAATRSPPSSIYRVHTHLSSARSYLSPCIP